MKKIVKNAIFIVILIVIAMSIFNISYAMLSTGNFSKLSTVKNTTVFTKDNDVKYSNLQSYKIENKDYNNSAYYQTIKVKRNTVATYEMGRSIPSDAAIALICQVFHISEFWLRTGNGEMLLPITKDEKISEMLSDIQSLDDKNFKHRLISALSNLDDAGWNALEKLIDSISDGK